MSRVIIDDVARLAGVSIKTVSRVMNNETGVAERTRHVVRQAAEQLDYRPSAAARALASNRSNLIGLVYDNPSPYYINEVQRGAQERCASSKMRVLMQTCDVASGTALEEIVRVISEAHLDGVVLTPPVSDRPEVVSGLAKLSIPFALVAPGRRDGPAPHVGMDDKEAAKAMTRHLIELGHRRIAFIVGHPAHLSSRLRLDGYRAALGEAGVAVPDELIREGLFDFDSGLSLGGALLDLEDRPTAIFASNDDMAAGAMAAAHARRLDVPADVSIAGFDDTNLAKAVWPALTTVRQPVREQGWAATDLLLALIAGHAKPSMTLPYELVKRASVGPA